MPNFRLGTEMADRARFWGRVGGIFHTDELPAYGITAEEIEEAKKATKTKEQDAIVFVADSLENAKDALKAVTERAHEAIKGVPEETRAPNPDGTTRYMRPRPGAARMYPETDIPPAQITEDYIRKISLQLPEPPEKKFNRLMREYKLNQKLVKQILDSEYGELFEVIVKESSISSTTVVAFLTEAMKALKRDGVQVDKISDNQIKEIFKHVGSGQLTKEAISDVAIWLSKHENASVDEAIVSLELKMISKEALEKIIEEVIEKNKDLIKERGAGVFDPLMGMVMKEVRGKASVQLVSEVLKKKLQQKG
jgi:glutamyl-tRNA(Gln) amidotransferase subunit E